MGKLRIRLLHRPLRAVAAAAAFSISIADFDLVAAADVEPAAAAAEAGEPAAELPRLPERRGPYVHGFGALSIGRGLRFNNPYRLQTSLGDEPESLSLSATYLSVLAGAALGDPDGLQHGLSFDLAVALDGITQEVLTPSYVVLHRLPPRTWIWGRAGTPVVLEPDLNLGLEAGAGAVWLVRAGIGLTAELIGSIFYGAATLDRPITVIPMLSLQVGVRADYEMLP